MVTVSTHAGDPEWQLFGPLTVGDRRWLTRSAVAILDGEDVTRHCFAASERDGWVDCYVPAPRGGGLMLDRHGESLFSERRHGKVRLSLKPDASAAAREDYRKHRAELSEESD